MKAREKFLLKTHFQPINGDHFHCIKFFFRYDKDNACRASRQLTRNFIKWSSVYNINCDLQKENKFHGKMTEAMLKIESRMKKRLGCDMEDTE